MLHLFYMYLLSVCGRQKIIPRWDAVHNLTMFLCDFPIYLCAVQNSPYLLKPHHSQKNSPLSLHWDEIPLITLGIQIAHIYKRLIVLNLVTLISPNHKIQCRGKITNFHLCWFSAMAPNNSLSQTSHLQAHFKSTS